MLNEWPEGEAQPTKFPLSTMAVLTSTATPVHMERMCRRIERDYQAIRDELGLNQYEGRNWHGFHHHASLCIAAYAFLAASDRSTRDKRRGAHAKNLPYPKAMSRQKPQRYATPC